MQHSVFYYVAFASSGLACYFSGISAIEAAITTLEEYQSDRSILQGTGKTLIFSGLTLFSAYYFLFLAGY